MPMALPHIDILDDFHYTKHDANKQKKDCDDKENGNQDQSPCGAPVTVARQLLDGDDNQQQAQQDVCFLRTRTEAQ